MTRRIIRRIIQSLLLVVTLFCFLVTPVAAELSEAEQDVIRAQFAAELITIAGGQNYRVDCGDSTVLNTNKFLSTDVIPGYEPIVCVLNKDTNRKAVMMAIQPDQGNIPAYLTHYLLYGDELIENPHILKDRDVDETACESANPVGDPDIGWMECEGAVDKANYRVYMKHHQFMNSDDTPISGSPSVMLFTYNIEPPFSTGFWDDILDFFRNLFGIGSAGNDYISTNDVSAFWKGYFAHSDEGRERSVKGLLTRTGSGGGDATIILQGFGTNFSSLVDYPEDYVLGSNHKQVLFFYDITVHRWNQLTSALRIHHVPGEPIPGDECGNGFIGFDEECEPDGNTYIGEYTQCNELLNPDGSPRYNMGALSCDPQTCLYDVTSCVKCEDQDDDDYPVAAGIPTAIDRLGGELTIGSTFVDTNYDTTAPDWTTESPGRQALGIGAQAVMLPTQYLMDGDGFAVNAYEESLGLLSAAVDACTDNFDVCLWNAMSDDRGLANASLIGGFFTTKMKEEYIPATEDVCTWDTIIHCGGELQPAALGWHNFEGGTGSTNGYEQFFRGMYIDGVQPIMIIEPGELEGMSLSTTEEKVAVALQCAATAKATHNLWNEVNDGTGLRDVPLDTFQLKLLTAHQHNAALYYDYYQLCRAGIKAAIGSSAKLYYRPGEPTIENEHYTLLAQKTSDSDQSIIDGIVINNPISFASNSVHYKDDGDTYDYTPMAIRRENDAELLVFAAPTSGAADDDYSLVTKYLLGSLNINAQHVLFLGMRQGDHPLLAADAALNPAATLIRELMLSLDQTQLYRPVDATGKAQLLILHVNNGAVFAYVNDHLGGLGVPLPLSDCSDATIMTADETGMIAEEPSQVPADFETQVPAQLPFSQWEINDWTCFLGDDPVGTCTAQFGVTLDCNDTDDSINPGEEEDCTNGVDDDCDGLVDEDLPDNSCSDPIVPPSDCNFDGTCDDGEDFYACSDCYLNNLCPSEWALAHTQGAYSFYVRFNPDGRPELRIESDNRMSGSVRCNWAAEGSADANPNPKEMPWTADIFVATTIFHNEGDDWAKVEVGDTFSGGWRVKYTDGGSVASRECWDWNSGSGEIVNIRASDYASCYYHECEVRADCCREVPGCFAMCVGLGTGDLIRICNDMDENDCSYECDGVCKYGECFGPLQNIP